MRQFERPPSSVYGLWPDYISHVGQLLHQELNRHTPFCLSTNEDQPAGFQSQGPYHDTQLTPRAFDCPSIQITTITHNNHVEADSTLEVLAAGGAEGGYCEPSWPRDQLYLPLDSCYRETALSLSPCSSLSSRSWISDLTSCESFSHVYEEEEGEPQDAALLALGSPGCGGGAFGVELWQQKYQHPSPFSPVLSPHQSPSQSPQPSVTEETWLNRRPTSRPSSRPTSPCGKRPHSSADPLACSPSASPTPGTSPRGSVTEDTWLGSPATALGTILISGCQELDVPSKTRRTSGSNLCLLAGQGGPGLQSYQNRGEEQEQGVLAELFLPVPSHFSWSKPKPGNLPLFSPSSPPPLDWPLPSQYGQTELKLEVQPKSYHRAHYETEGSRGSIKGATGGHPVIRLNGYNKHHVNLLLFIGAADDRCLRPHSFYQVHRVTGKTVTTMCLEKMVGCSKVLEIPLLPENNMSASIDCAGILKLRNADIELKKGEVDIGRKNTRIRVVFRVAVPQQDGRMLWLQTASVPVECSQRSGQELPHVENFCPVSCCEDGREELRITGSNMSTQSRVVFLEKGPDGRPLWEVDARVLPEKSNESRITVEVPPYHKKTTSAVQVQFYVSNGKRRRSLMQSFTYSPGVRHPHPAQSGIKQEPWGLDHIFCQPPSEVKVLRPDVAYVSSPVPPLLRHPASSSFPLQASLIFPQNSAVPHKALKQIQFQSRIPPPGQASSVPLQTISVPCQMPPGGLLLKQCPSLSSGGISTIPAESQKESLPAGPGGVLSIKQEPGNQPNLRSLGLQEITLDDGRKLDFNINLLIYLKRSFTEKTFLNDYF
uniref:RHD domain-containing protein n=2 Tax=Nothobranchius furzeri TaxID=105023 RepID=A0A8C6M634_NOTFU